MSATIVIPTLGRPEVAARCVEAVLNQLEAGDECLMVVQGTPEQRRDVAAAVSEYLAHADKDERESLRILEQEEASRTLARNRGILAASTEYVAFLDDDTIPRESWLRALLAPLQEGRAELVAGRLREEPDQTTNAPDVIGAHLTVTGHTRRNYNTPSSGPSGLAPGGNMATCRELAIDAGGFDPLFGPGAIYEDVEFSERLRHRGARVWYEGSAEVDHLAVRTGAWWERDLLAWEEDRARSMSIIFRRHRPRSWLVMACAYVTAALLKTAAGRFPLHALVRIPVALGRGRRQGREVPPRLTPQTASEGDS